METENLNQLMKLNLREDSEIRIVMKDAMNYNATGLIYGRKQDGCYRLEMHEVEKKRKGTFKVARLLGPWWIESAIKGTIDQIPVVNVKPIITKLDKPYTFDASNNSSIKKIRSNESNVLNSNNNNSQN